MAKSAESSDKLAVSPFDKRGHVFPFDSYDFFKYLLPGFSCLVSLAIFLALLGGQPRELVNLYKDSFLITVPAFRPAGSGAIPAAPASSIATQSNQGSQQKSALDPVTWKQIFGGAILLLFAAYFAGCVCASVGLVVLERIMVGQAARWLLPAASTTASLKRQTMHLSKFAATVAFLVFLITCVLAGVDLAWIDIDKLVIEKEAQWHLHGRRILLILAYSILCIAIITIKWILDGSESERTTEAGGRPSQPAEPSNVTTSRAGQITKSRSWLFKNISLSNRPAITIVLFILITMAIPAFLVVSYIWRHGTEKAIHSIFTGAVGLLNQGILTLAAAFIFICLVIVIAMWIYMRDRRESAFGFMYFFLDKILHIHEFSDDFAKQYKKLFVKRFFLEGYESWRTEKGYAEGSDDMEEYYDEKLSMTSDNHLLPLFIINSECPAHLSMIFKYQELYHTARNLSASLLLCAFIDFCTYLYLRLQFFQDGRIIMPQGFEPNILGYHMLANVVLGAIFYYRFRILYTSFYLKSIMRAFFEHCLSDEKRVERGAETAAEALPAR